MFRSGFFTSTSWTINEDGFAIGNKAEGSDFFAKIVSTMVPDGVPYLPTSNLQILATTGMILSVGAGFGFKDGYLAWETADTTITCTSSASEQTLYISARLDTTTGEFTGDKVDKYTTFVAETDLCFAVVVIPANAVTITNAMITDVRSNATYCGLITDQREYLETLILEIQTQLSNVIGGGMPDHASTHAPSGDDELTSYLTTFSMINGGGVFTGGAVTAQGSPDQTVAVSAGSIITPEGKRYAFGASATLAASAADGTHPRIDIVYVTSAGVVTYLAGTAAASPAQPATPSNGTILAAITRAANDNTIATSDITDQRDFITTANDFEDVTTVTENSNAFACDFAKKHTKNFSFSITNTTAKTVTFANVPYGTCDSIISIKATGTAAVTWTLDGRTLVWPAGAPTLTSGYTYDILFSYSPLLGKWVGRAQLGAAN